MRAMILALLLASLTVDADEFILKWTPPTQYTEGTVLLEQDIDYYTLYIDGVALTNFDSIIGQWSVSVTFTEPGSYEGNMTVVTVNGAESDFSNPVNFTVGPRTPGAITNLTVEKVGA